jgi:stage V sporulation protein SpoVS
VLALQALHAAGVNRPELIARAFGSYAARKGGGPSQAVEAAATVRAVRAIGIMTASLDPVEHPHADPRGA